jgi:pimeloyl-ACP methyl ester carboxylesterase
MEAQVPANKLGITLLKHIRIVLLSVVLSLTVAAFGQDTKSTAAASATVTPQSQQPPTPRLVELKASDGTVLKATYFTAAKPGPGVLLLHQNNRTRSSWDDVAKQLAPVGISTLSVDNRGHGGSGGEYDKWTNPNHEQANAELVSDLDTAFHYLVTQPGVKRDLIGMGGAGLLGIDNSVQTARQHSAEVKSLALLSGETFLPGLQFLRQASQLPELFVVDDNDEYPPTVEAMHLLYSMASNPGKKFVHYSAAHDAP